MNQRQITLNQPEENVKLNLNREYPFCRILNIELITDIEKTEFSKYPAFIGYELIRGNGGSEKGSFGTSNSLRVDPIDLKQVKNLFINYTLRDDSSYSSVKLVLTFEIMDKLDITIPTAGFDKHLDDNRNVKILFSAPFGQGKTTFLNQYFNERLDKYNVFKLFPINYSVASNQDIFKYIKSDILIQLLERSDIDFQNITQNYSDSFYSFFKEHPEKVLAPLLLMIPKIGKSLFSLNKELNALKDAFMKHHAKLEINDSDKAFQFINDLIEEEGSIYESDFFTQLIRTSLEQLKLNSPEKENVLLIDDLDRMDPDHIFRILNILSAHYDIFHNNPSEENNKFGFDRIILVGDYENIKCIYEYRYGSKVDFSGYFNKYFSTTAFRFDNLRVMKELLFDIDGENTSRFPNHLYHKKCFFFLAKLFLDQNQLTLRQILKLRLLGLSNKREKLYSCEDIEGYAFKNGGFTPAIFLFSELDNPIGLIDKIEQLNEETAELDDITLNLYCLSLIAGLQKDSDRKVADGTYLDKTYSIRMHSDDVSIVRPETHKIPDSGSSSSLDLVPKITQFEFDHFKELLILNIERFNNLKHLI